MAFEADMLRIDRGVGLQVVHGAACAPGPRAQSAPVIEAAWLSMIHQSDDSLGEPGAVVGLKARRREHGKTPSSLQQRLPFDAIVPVTRRDDLGDRRLERVF